jgi:DNA recombination protein RmuC
MIALSVSSTTARSFVSIRLVAVPWALQERSSEVWQLLGAIKTEFDRYGTVVNTLSRQLTAASNSVDSLAGARVPCHGN